MRPLILSPGIKYCYLTAHTSAAYFQKINLLLVMRSCYYSLACVNMSKIVVSDE